MTIAVGHLEDKIAVIDAVREVRPPCSPESVVIELCDLLKANGIRRIEGDRYAGEWPRERFREHGVEDEPAAKPKSDIYRESLAGAAANVMLLSSSLAIGEPHHQFGRALPVLRLGHEAVTILAGHCIRNALGMRHGQRRQKQRQDYERGLHLPNDLSATCEDERLRDAHQMLRPRGLAGGNPSDPFVRALYLQQMRG